MNANTTHSLKRWPTTLLLVMSGLLSACASLPSDSKNHHEFSSLGDADAHLTYSTAFPVASAREAILRGDTAASKGDLGRALFEYIRGLEKAGADGETFYKIGRVHLARKDPERARLAFLLCLKSLPDHVGALVEMGKLEMHRRNYGSAKTLLLHALEINPNSPLVFNTLGVIADIEKDHQQAQKNYIQASFLDGNKPIYMNNLGYSYYLMGNQDRAEQMFVDTLKIDPNYKLAWRNLGLVYGKSARYKLALEAFGKTEKEYQAYNDVGYVAMLSGRYDDAQHYFGEALRLSPAYYELAARNAKHLDFLRQTRVPTDNPR
jgi:Flp pilus assembly protein TadD